MKEIKHCEVCDNETLIPKLNLGLHPMCDDLIKVGDPRQNKEYLIEILFCEKCFTAHQKYQIPKKELFPSDYHYRARFTKDVLSGMEALVADLETKFGDLKNKAVLDIGCNDGSLLSFFMAKGALTYGIDPTDAANDAKGKSHIVIQDYFSKEVAESYLKYYHQPDIITFTNVFAHIEDLNSVLDALKIIMKEDTILVIENHYLGAVIEKNQFDTFYHEHPRTYSLMSFAYIANKLGKNLTNYSFPSRYGGNIRVVISNIESDFRNDVKYIRSVLDNEIQFGEQLTQMNQTIINWQMNKIQEILGAVQEYGPLVAKAFPGRSAIPVKMLGLTEKDIKCVYERPGSLKIGYKIPSTEIPIVSEDEVQDWSKIPVILNLAWHINSEIESYLREKGFVGKIINII